MHESYTTTNIPLNREVTHHRLDNSKNQSNHCLSILFNNDLIILHTNIYLCAAQYSYSNSVSLSVKTSRAGILLKMMEHVQQHTDTSFLSPNILVKF